MELPERYRYGLVAMELPQIIMHYNVLLRIIVCYYILFIINHYYGLLSVIVKSHIAYGAM